MNLFPKIISLIKSDQNVPVIHKGNFFHLYMDIFWFGVLNGTAISFIAIYAARQGASALQIGLINAAPGLVTFLFALPAGSWLQKRSLGKTVFWSAIFTRIFYLLLVPLPLLFIPEGQIWAIIAITFLMNIPGTVLAVGFTSLLGDAVPIEWRGHVVGIRNALVALTTSVTSIIAGQILTHMEFPGGYQVVFFIGFFGAMMSTFHLFFIRPVLAENTKILQGQSGLAIENKGMQRISKQFRLDILKSPFGKILVLLFGFHLFQYLAIPVFPIYSVNYIKLSDQTISLGTSIFNVMVFLGSTQFSRVSRRWGNRKTLALGIMILAGYPLILSVSTGESGYWIASVLGGSGWSLVGAAIFNYILENVPDYDRPSYLAWYNLVFNAAVLIGSFGGPAIGGLFGMQAALVIFAVGRLFAGIAIFRWG